MKVALLGGTGAVGQRFVQMLSRHPWFELTVITGKTSVGKRYEEAAKWMLETDMPEDVKDMVVQETKVENLKGVDLVFSALPSKEAKTFERELLKREFP